MSVRDWKGTAKMTVKKLGEIIGTTGDTGGTATAGTLIAKVNAILKGQGTQAAESTSQEILEKVGSLAPSIDGKVLKTNSATIASATTKTVFSITGKGKLFGAVLVDYYNDIGAIKLTVTIDGTDYYAILAPSSANAYRKAILFAPFNTPIMVDTSNNNHKYYQGVLIGTGSIYPCSFGETKTVRGTDAILATFDGSLPFEESMTVSVTTKGTDANCTVWYTLED